MAEKIGADEAGVRVGKPEVDHPPDRDRHDQRRARGDGQRGERRGDARPVDQRVRRQRLQRAERDAGRLRAGVGGG